MTTIESYQVLGTTEDVTTCGCCGRQNLKETVAIAIDGADPVYLGVVCAAKAVKGLAADIRKAAGAADRARDAAARAERDRQDRERHHAWLGFLVARWNAVRPTTAAPAWRPEPTHDADLVRAIAGLPASLVGVSFRDARQALEAEFLAQQAT